MSPGGDNGEKPPLRPAHLRLLEGGAELAPPAEGTVSSAPPPPDSGPNIRIELPPRFVDSPKLHHVIDGLVSKNPYEFLRNALAELANPRAGGGYDVTFTFRNTRYRLLQADPASPIELTVIREQGGAVEELLRMNYQPNGKVSSGAHPEPHGDPIKNEATHDRILQRSILAERAQRMMLGQDVYVRLRIGLEALRARYTPETQSVWYDNFVVHEGGVYSFRIRNLLGLPGMAPNPQTSQVSVYEERGAERIKILTVSATGENNWSATRPDREPLSSQQLELLKQLVLPLERARENPTAYQRQLHGALAKVNPRLAARAPEIVHSVDIPRTFGPGYGLRREPIMEFRSGWDLFRHFHPWASHRWENPENSHEVRRLAPRWRLSLAMGRELMRMIGIKFNYWTFGRWSSPKPVPDLIRLQLFPEGGGQLSIYRAGNLHDILIAEPRGPVWRASREIRRMERSGAVFENPLAAFEAAVAARTGTQTLPEGFQLQPAPHIELARLHLNQDGSKVEIRDVQTAWERIRLQIPDGIHPRVQSVPKSSGSALARLLPGPTEVDRIHVDFRESQPIQNLDLRHFDIPAGDGPPVRRVEIVMRSGENTHARVFEDGVMREEIERDNHNRLLIRAQEGNLPVSRWALAAQAIPRIYGFYKVTGGTYACSYFLALPATLGLERLMLSDEQRRLYGTPVPRLSLRYFLHDFTAPFAAMSTASGVTSVLIDGIYNMRPGLARSYRMWQAGATMTEAWRHTKPSFFHEFPNVRPIGRNFWFRGFLQRAAPLFAGVVALELLHHDEGRRPPFWRTAANVGGVSAGSALLLRGLYSSERISLGLQRWGLVEDTLKRALLAEEIGAGAGMVRSGMTRVASRVSSMSRSSRLGLTFRGGVVLATLELIALGVLATRDRRALFAQAEGSLRDATGQAIDRRNEIITRLEHGEEIPPRLLLTADQELETAQAAYRRFLEIAERTGTTGSYETLTLDNDFEEAYSALERERTLLGRFSAASTAGFQAATLIAGHERRLVELRNRSDALEHNLSALYRRYGAPAPTGASPEEGLRAFLTRVSADPSAAAGGAPAVAAPTSPIAVDSLDGRAVVEQLRWKSARDPSFLLAGSEHRARYILRQFSGYQVREADGNYRPWNIGEALAFLGEVDRANARRAANLENSLSVPGAGEGYDTSRLDAMFAEEREIRSRELATHRHVRHHAERLAGRVGDFDRQMEAYYRMSNARMGRALERFMEEPPLLAMNP